MGVFLSTVSGNVKIDDLDGRVFTHPVVDFDLLSQWSPQDIYHSDDLQAALDIGTITMKLDDIDIHDIQKDFDISMVENLTVDEMLTVTGETHVIHSTYTKLKYGGAMNDGILQIDGRLAFL
jgi:hypothetical protein